MYASINVVLQSKTDLRRSFVAFSMHSDWGRS